ncbi:hypothetical protein STAQ_27620 [Allostella sp. ATCC 35155]|nr:hypothetical protein STAQ_27620 [Stella sp. ATCC 35155]
MKSTSPWGSSEEDEEARKLAEQVPAPALAAEQIKAFFAQRQAMAGRHKAKARPE